MVDSDVDVKEVVWRFFHQKYGEPDTTRYVLEGISTKSLCLSDVQFLESPFTYDEIKVSV